jgi:TonB dependent receptor
MWVKLVAALRTLAPRLAAAGACALGCASWLSDVSAQDAGVAPEHEQSDATARYGAKARVAPDEPPATQFSASETQAVQHSMGPAFSIAESLPGVVPVFSGVPYLIIRGATPAGSLTYYDGVEIPSLFHLALGPGVIDTRLQGDVHFHAGAAPARYGAHIGGVIDQDGPDTDTLRTPVRSVQLSLLDVSGFVNVPTPDGGLSLSWRYGNAGAVLGALGLNATLSYFDYQLRYATVLDAHTRLLVLALGAGDQLGDRDAPADDIVLSFHRLLTRLTYRVNDLEFGAQLMFGADLSTLGQQISGQALRGVPSLYAQWRKGTSSLRVGTELSSALAKLTRGSEMTSSTAQSFRTSRLTLDPEDFLDGQPFSAVPTRTLASTYAELHLEPGLHLQLDLGLRAELWLAGSHADAALSPSLFVRQRATDWLELHAAAALVHKPRTSPLPIPGLNDVALDAGVESALQSEVGASVRLDPSTLFEANLFYHRYMDVVYLELILDCQGNTDPSAAQALLTQRNPLSSICRRSGLPTADGESHGLELFLKRDLTDRLSGFLSYTFAFANATAHDGTRFTPEADVRHLLNAVLQYDFHNGFSLGLRVQYRTGKMAVNTIFDVAADQFTRLEYRLPGFLRADVHASYGWPVSFGRLEATVGVQNATFSREATNRNCFSQLDQVVCQVDYQPYIVLPNVSLRADF